MRKILIAGTVSVLAVLTACVPPPAPPPPAPPPPAPAPTPAPPPPPTPPPPADWRDAPLSPGDWSYGQDGAATVARFGPPGAPSLSLRCEARRLTLVRHGASAPSLTIRTTYGDRTLPATPSTIGAAANFAVSDQLLDQMMFSRGRFMVQAPGAAALIIPAWPEPSRVIEDCRG